MAEVVAIKLELDAGQSVKEVQKLEDAIAEINNTSSSLTVDEKFEMLNSTLDTTTATFGEMSQAIESYKTIALNAGRESPVGKEALLRASQLKDRIADIDREVDNLALDAQYLQGALQISGGVIAGYQAFAGVTALVGDENEALMETMVKLQASMSVLQAIEQIRLATEKESVAMQTLNNAKTKIAIGLQKAYAFAVGTGTPAMKGLRAALLATGVGAIIVALGTIVAYWDDIKGAVSGLSSEQKKRNKQLEEEMELSEKALDSVSATENSLRLQGKSEQEILDLKTAQLDRQIQIQQSVIDNAETQKKTQLEASKRNQKITQNIIRILTLPLTMVLKTVDLMTKAISKIPGINIETNLEEGFSKGVASFLFDPEAVEKEGNETINTAKDKLAELQNTRDGYTLKEQEKNKANYEKRKEQQRKQDEEELQALRDKMQKEFDLQNELEDAIIEGIQDEDARKLAQLKLQHERELDAIRDKYGMQTELEAQLLRNQAEELNLVKQEIALKDKEVADFFEAEEEARQEALVAKNIELTKKELEEVEKTEEAKRQLRADTLSVTSDLIGALGGLFDKNEKVQKATALAQIGIDTAKAISSLVANSQANPANAVTGGIAGAVQFGTGLAQILSNIAKAKQILTSGSTSGAGGAVVTPPSFNPNTTINSSSQTQGNSVSQRTDVPTSKVVLVESELQFMQERRRNTELISTI